MAATTPAALSADLEHGLRRLKLALDATVSVPKAEPVRIA